MTRSDFFSARVLLCAVGLVAGCGKNSGPAVYPVSGTVLYEDEPVSGALVTFYGEQAPRLATGTTDSQGRFELTTLARGDGTVEGRHRVTVSKIEVEGVAEPGSQDVSMEEAMRAPAVPIQTHHGLPARYADPARPLLEVTVSATEKNDFTLLLE